jgi:hypothetical protein
MSRPKVWAGAVSGGIVARSYVGGRGKLEEDKGSFSEFV